MGERKTVRLEVIVVPNLLPLAHLPSFIFRWVESLPMILRLCLMTLFKLLRREMSQRSSPAEDGENSGSESPHG